MSSTRRRTAALMLVLATGLASTGALAVTAAPVSASEPTAAAPASEAPAAAPTAAAPTSADPTDAPAPDQATRPATTTIPDGVTDADARSGAVSAILLDGAGRPRFVEVVAPTLSQAVLWAQDVPGSDGVAFDTPMTSLATTDPLRPRQWSLDRLRVDSLPAADDRARHLVAVVDSGVLAGHEDFAPGQVRCDLGADLTGEALGACADPHGHGTHVAGIVGALSGNGKGVASIAPGTAILPVRVLDRSGSGGSTGVARGIVHAADKGAAVINLSLGGPGRSAALDAAVQYATDRGALVVASAGNNRQTGNAVNYPAASPGVLAVASTDANGLSSPFSHSGPAVDIAAPGGGIVSTWGNGAYAALSGTSMAAPAVSAVASLYRAAHPQAGPAEVSAALVATAQDLEAPGRDPRTGAGLVDPYRLLVAGPAPAVRLPAAHVQVVTPRVSAGQAVTVRLSDFRPASTVSVSEIVPVVQRVRVRTTVRQGGRTVPSTRVVTRRTNRTVVLAQVRVPADGAVEARVLPVQGVRDGQLVVRGVDRGGRVVQRVTAVRVG
jgi:subtilisin family serine protease